MPLRLSSGDQSNQDQAPAHGATDQGQLTSDERAELNRLRKENRELKREKDFFKLAAAQPWSPCPTKSCHHSPGGNGF